MGRFPGSELGSDVSPISPYRIVEDCLKVLPEDVMLSLDSGVHHNWYMQFWKARRPSRC